MEVQFPVNSGNVPPPSQSTNLLVQQLNLQNPLPGNGGLRRKPKQPVKKAAKLDLERILGLTSISPNILSVTDDLIAYAAGAVVVLYSQKKNKQVALLYPPPSAQSTNGVNDNNNATGATNFQNQVSITPLGNGNSKKNDLLTSTQPSFTEAKKATPVSNRAKPVSSLSFSPNGNYLAVGEMGHQPRIFIWDVKEKKLLRELRSHKFGVLALSFSPNMRHLVSVGFQHDGYLYVWDWKRGTKIAGNKVTSRINAISFSKDGSYFVTAGLRHVRFWYLNGGGKLAKREGFHSRETRVLDGRSGLLGVLRDANFVDVACDKSKNTGYTYLITESGILCSFKAERVLDKWLDLQVKYAYAIAVTQKYIICSCSGGVIRLFEPVTLKYIGILPKPHPLGVDVTAFTSPSMVRQLKQASVYPDSVAMVYEAESDRVISIYSDRSLYVWDIHDIAKIVKSRSFVFHSDCVWGVEPCPRIEYEDNLIPLNSFATFSADGTIRIWNVDNPSSSQTSPTDATATQKQQTSLLSPSSSTTVSAHRRNIYSRELVKMVYVDPEAAEFSKIRSDLDTADNDYPDYDIRSVRISSDGSIIASGDRCGNLRIHDLTTWKLLSFQEAHDSEILAIDLIKSNNTDLPSLIATASRDRMIHIFDINSQFQLIQSLDDHSSSITAVRFTKDGSKLISCGADKGVIFRHLTEPITPYSSQVSRPFTTYHNYSGRSTVFDMAIDVNDRHIATVTGERRLFVFNVDTGKSFRTCKPETADELGKTLENTGGSLINVDLDPFSGTYAVTSGSDRCIRLFDLINNICVDKVCAHAELITSVKFVQTNIEKFGLRIISTCSDGTIFIWRVPPEIVLKMRTRAGERNLYPKETERVTNGIYGTEIYSQNGYFTGVKHRLHRNSAIDEVTPVVSISHVGRRPQRKTFSSQSAAEQKYEKLHSKIAISHGHQRNSTSVESTTEKKAPDSDRFGSAVCEGEIIDSKPSKSDNNSANTVLNKGLTGKIQSLYNGVPTSMTSARQTALSNRQINPMLRRARSRDVLRNGTEQRFAALATSKIDKEAALDTLNDSTNKIIFSSSRRISLPTSSTRISDEDIKTQQIDLNEVKEFIECDSGDADSEYEAKKDSIGSYLEEENEIIFTPEEETANDSFQVTVNNNREDELTGRCTPDTDNEAQSKSEEEDDELSSEDNIDEVINRDIISPEAPRITISRSSSMAKKLGRHSFHFQGINAKAVSSIDGLHSLSSAAEPSLETPSKTADKIYKRQSLTARFLSSLSLSRNNKIAVQPPIDQALCSIRREQASQPTKQVDLLDAGSTAHVEKLTIDVAPVLKVQVSQGTGTDEKRTVIDDNATSDTVKLNAVLNELDKMTSTMDTVLETYVSYRNTSKRQQVLDIERKLNCINNKISQIFQQKDSLTTETGTNAILEKYSSLLVAMVENKLNR